MTQQPFSRPGAIDLSALRRPAQSQGQPAGQAPTGGPTAPAAGGTGAPAAPRPASPTQGVGGSAYSVEVDEQSFQSVLEASMTAPVILVFHAASRSPESEQMARDVAAVADDYEGRFLAGLIDVDAVPQIAQAMQIPSVPLMLVLIDGRPASQPIQGIMGAEEIRMLFDQLTQQLTAQGIAGRHQPRTGVVAHDEDGEPELDPRYAPAQDALEAGDIDRAVAEYQKLVDANPADAEAAAGLAMAKVLQRTQGVDLNSARQAAADAPDDVDAQTMVADLDLLGGHVDDAFNRLIALVGRTVGDDKARARDHLLGLFAAVGNDDPRVQRGRRDLASALF
jgi:thioredoxin-like negative regulator of GroEL